MKKIIISLIFMSFLAPECFATSSFKTFTPTTQSYNSGYHHRHNNSRRHNKHKNYNRYNCPYHNHYNGYRNYNRYYPNNTYYPNDGTYYYKSSFFDSLKDFFGGGQVTGYTPSYDSSFDNSQYNHLNGMYDPNGNLYGTNYGFNSGASIKILD